MLQVVSLEPADAVLITSSSSGIKDTPCHALCGTLSWHRDRPVICVDWGWGVDWGSGDRFADQVVGSIIPLHAPVHVSCRSPM